MRGKEGQNDDASGQAGITPAHAGKSGAVLGDPAGSWDHPRTCGEKCWYLPPWSGLTGSPPHMRGKELIIGPDGADIGITPAHAGKSYESWLRAWLPRDHPRTCGEKTGITAGVLAFRGSPPHMRGKGADTPRNLPADGITPAHAGKRPRTSWSARPTQDHPRTCGEKTLPWIRTYSTMGSPPHMRGKVH